MRAAPKVTKPRAEHKRDAAYVLRWLERRGTKKNRDGMARYAIVAPKMFGVSMTTMKSLARQLGKDHRLAAELWATGWFEARMLTSFVEVPAAVTADQMDAWAADFDNWAICDTICFHLFDKSPLVWRKIGQWSRRKEEFVRRAAFALIASVALHDKKAPDAPFAKSLKLIERAATDERNFVKKGVSWALRSIGHRNPKLTAASLALARKFAASPDRTARWIGKDAVRDLERYVTKKANSKIARSRRIKPPVS